MSNVIHLRKKYKGRVVDPKARKGAVFEGVDETGAQGSARPNTANRRGMYALDEVPIEQLTNVPSDIEEFMANNQIEEAIEEDPEDAVSDDDVNDAEQDQAGAQQNSQSS